jgi:hypothetical protein
MSGRNFALLALLTFGAAWFGLRYFDRSGPIKPTVAPPSGKESGPELGFTAPPGPPEPWCVIRMEPFRDFLQDYEYIVRRFADDPALVRMVQQSVEKYVTPEARQHYDLARPVGAYLVSEADGKNIEVVLMLPLMAEKSIPAVARLIKEQAREDDEEPGLFRVHMTGWKDRTTKCDHYVRYHHGYAYVSAVHDLVEADRVLPPAEAFQFSSRGMFSTKFRLAHLPATVKSTLLAGLTQLENDPKLVTTEPGPKRQLELVGQRWFCRALRAVVEDGEAWTFHFGINRSTGQLSAEWSLTPREGTALAEQLAALGASKSRFAALPSRDSAFTLLSNLPLPDDFRTAFGQVVVNRSEQDVERTGPRPAARADDDSVFQAFKPAVAAGGFFDGAFTLRGPTKNGNLLFLGGMRATNGADIESALRKRAANLAKGDKNRPRLDIAKVGDVSIHRVDEWRGETLHLGDPGRYVALGSDALWAASGEGAVAALKEVVAAPSAEAPLFEMVLSVSRLHALMDANQAAQVIRRVFGDAKELPDRMSATLTGGPALTLRLTMHLDVIKYLYHLDPPKRETPSSRG